MPADLGGRVGIGAQALDAFPPAPIARISREAAAAGTPCSSRNSRTARSPPRRSQERHGLGQLARPDARDLAEPPARVTIDGLEHAGAVALEQPRGARRAHVLDRCEVADERLLRGRRGGAHPLDEELPAVLGVLAPAPAGLEALALVDMGERPGERDLLAVVGHRGQHGEVLARPAHRHHLGRQLLHRIRT